VADGRAIGAVCAVLIAVVVIVGVAFSLRFAGLDSGRQERRAIIIDQLGITDPNPGFLRSATRDLLASGFEVEYVEWQAVSVDFFRSLPQNRYSLVIVRSHSAVSPGQPEGPSRDGRHGLLSLFTSERYLEDRHIKEQIGRTVNRVRLQSPQREQAYFGVTSEFVRADMRGRLHGADVVLMGCDGMVGSDMPIALRERGAGTIVGWDGPVTADHTDNVVRRLIELVAREGVETDDAVRQTMSEVGPDPLHESHLVVFP
jgi:hypothetical protein